MNDFATDQQLLDLYLKNYPGKTMDEAVQALDRLKTGLAAQQRRASEESTQGVNAVLNNMGGAGIDLNQRKGVLDQNIDAANKAEPLRQAALQREIERMNAGVAGVKDLKQTETADLNSILSQIEADSKRRNTRGMIKNILGGAALFF
tara:strand:- start:311 stop:754 length:444 start_codon:yes stop_codon:yes gene_type:complete